MREQALAIVSLVRIGKRPLVRGPTVQIEVSGQTTDNEAIAQGAGCVRARDPTTARQSQHKNGYESTAAGQNS